MYGSSELFVLFTGPVALVGSILIFGGACLIYIRIFLLTPNNLLLFCSFICVTAGRRRLRHEIRMIGKIVLQLFDLVLFLRLGLISFHLHALQVVVLLLLGLGHVVVAA